jgi:hypothetical protein
MSQSHQWILKLFDAKLILCHIFYDKLLQKTSEDRNACTFLRRSFIYETMFTLLILQLVQGLGYRLDDLGIGVTSAG